MSNPRPPRSAALRRLCLTIVLSQLLAMPLFSQALPNRPKTIDAFLALGERTRVIAHRGDSGSAPENTLAAFRAAIEVEADMVELDVTLSSDGEVVVIHDDTLERTTGVVGKVQETSMDELRELDAGSWFDSRFEGEKIPTLGEALDLMKDHILVNVEIKGEAVTDEVRGGLPAKVVALVRERGMADQVIVSSFEPRALEQVREVDPEIRTASLFSRERHRGLSPTAVMDEVGSVAFSIKDSLATSAMVEECHGLGRPIAVYTVNEESAMKKMIALGIDAMFTDHPARLMALVRASTTP